MFSSSHLLRALREHPQLWPKISEVHKPMILDFVVDECQASSKRETVTLPSLELFHILLQSGMCRSSDGKRYTWKANDIQQLRILPDDVPVPLRAKDVIDVKSDAFSIATMRSFYQQRLKISLMDYDDYYIRQLVVMLQDNSRFVCQCLNCLRRSNGLSLFISNTDVVVVDLLQRLCSNPNQLSASVVDKLSTLAMFVCGDNAISTRVSAKQLLSFDILLGVLFVVSSLFV